MAKSREVRPTLIAVTKTTIKEISATGSISYTFYSHFFFCIIRPQLVAKGEQVHNTSRLDSISQNIMQLIFQQMGTADMYEVARINFGH
jgi:hypothetical protein